MGISSGIGNSISLFFEDSLVDISGITPSDGQFIVGDGSNFVGESGATVRSSMGIGLTDTLTIATVVATTFVTAEDVAVIDHTITLNSTGTTSSTVGGGILMEGDAAAIVGYWKVHDSDSTLLQSKAPTGSIITYDINANSTFRLDANLTVLATSILNQNLRTTDSPTFDGLTLSTGNLLLSSTSAFISPGIGFATGAGNGSHVIRMRTSEFVFKAGNSQDITFENTAATTLLTIANAGNVTVANTLLAAQIDVDNVTINGNDVSSTSGNLTITPPGGSAVVIDGGASFDGTVVTGLTALTSTALTGTLQTAAQTNITSVGALAGGSIASGFGNIDIGSSTIKSGLISTYVNDAAVSANGIIIEQDGTGDAVLEFVLSGTKVWAIGIDNSDSDKFKIAATNDLNSDAHLTIDTNGNVNVPTGDLNVDTGDLFVTENNDGPAQIRVFNGNSGSSAFTELGIVSDTAALTLFLNSSTRTADGGADNATIRNNAGALLLQSSGSNGMTVAATTGIVTFASNVVLADAVLDLGGAGDLDDSNGIKLFYSNTDYKIGFDNNGGTKGYIRYNVDVVNATTHGHIFSAGDLSASTETDYVLINSAGINIGTTTSPTGTATKVLTFGLNGGDPTMGANTAGFFAKDVSSSGEMFGVDEADNVTQLTPHDPLTGEYYYHSYNTRTKRELIIMMEQMAKFIDKKFGTEFVKESKELKAA